MVKAEEKRDLLFSLADAYVSEQSKNRVFGRENAEGYSMAKGKLIGACMAFEIDIKENDKEVCLFSRAGRYILHIVKEPM